MPIGSYCTLVELKARLGGISGSSQDIDLQAAIDTASRAIEDHCNRFFWSATQTRTYEPTSYQCLTVDDLVSVTTLRTDAGGYGTNETTWATSDYQLAPVNAPLWSEVRPYTEIRAVGSQRFPCVYGYLVRRNLVEVTGTFGWPVVPVAVHQAALILAVDTYKLRDAPFGVQSFGEYGRLVRDNPRVTALLAPYRRYPVLVA